MNYRLLLLPVTEPTRRADSGGGKFHFHDLLTKLTGGGMVWRGYCIDIYPTESWNKLLRRSAIRLWVRRSLSSGRCVRPSGFSRICNIRGQPLRVSIAFLLFPFIFGQHKCGGLVQRRRVSLGDERLRRVARGIHVSGPCGQSVADRVISKSEFSPGPRSGHEEVLL